MFGTGAPILWGTGTGAILAPETPDMADGFELCSLDGEPALWSPGKAWVLPEGSDRWVEANSAEVGVNAAVLSPERFKTKFGDALPSFPSTAARHSGDKAL